MSNEIMQDYKFGAFIYFPERAVQDQIMPYRHKYDPVSAELSAPHITITQPLRRELNNEDINDINEVLSDHQKFHIRIGPPVSSPNQKMIWLDITPKDKILGLREDLHDTGLFRTDLAFTTGFIPHLTISEAERDPDKNDAIIQKLQYELPACDAIMDHVDLSRPGDNNAFKTERSFNLT